MLVRSGALSNNFKKLTLVGFSYLKSTAFLITSSLQIFLFEPQNLWQELKGNPVLTLSESQRKRE